MVDPILSSTAKTLNFRLLAVFFSTFFAISTAVLLYIYSEEKFNGLQNQQLPQWQQQIAYQQSIDNISRLLEQLLLSEHANNFSNKHQQLLSYFKQIDALMEAGGNGFQVFIYQHKKLTPTAQRLTANSQRNSKYQQQALSLIAKILPALQQDIAKQLVRQQQLYQQIVNDKLADSVTKSRAKAYVQISFNLQQLKIIEQNLTQLKFLLANLNLSTTEPTFSYLSTLVTNTFLAADSLMLEEAIKSSFLSLKALLVGDTNLIAKWRGQLRLAQLYREKINTWLTYFKQPIQLRIEQKQKNNSELLIKKISQYWPDFDEKTLITIAWSLFVFFVVLFILSLFLVAKATKLASNEWLSTIREAFAESTSSNKDLYADSADDSQDVIFKIRQLNQQAQGYQQQQLIIATLQERLTLLANCGQVCCWQYPWLKLTKNERVSLAKLVMLSDENTLLSNAQIWRLAFDKTQRRALINKAILAKNSACKQTIVVTSTQKVKLEITIVYQTQQHCFIAVIRNIEQQESAIDAQTSLQTRLAGFQQQFAIYQQKHQAELLKLGSELLVRSQLFSLQSKDDISNYYHLINQIVEYVKSQQHPLYWLATQYQLTDIQHLCRLQLSDVDLTKEHAAILTNIQQAAKRKKHQVFFVIQKEIATLVQIDRPLYHQLFSLLSSLLLGTQHKKQLEISVNLQDKNIGQQVLGITFKLHNAKSAIAEQLKLLINDEVSYNILTDECLVLKSVLVRLKVSDLLVSNDDNNVSLQFNLAMALSKAQNITALPDFKSQKFIIIGNQTIAMTALEQMVTLGNGTVIDKQTSTEFVQKYQDNNFNTQKIAAIIYVAAFNCVDIVFIEQHLKNLPVKLQPKLMILQEASLANLAQQGFFSENYNYLTPNVLKSLHQLLHDKKLTNQLVSQQSFTSNQYVASQVEVLVAGNNVQTLSYLSRLLTWLGLQVKVVASASSMLTYWKTGRYLVLFSEFTHSPFIPLTVGKGIKRGVFSLNKPLIPKTSIEEKLTQHWQVNSIASPCDLATLTRLLLPWLKKNAKDDALLPLTLVTKEVAIENKIAIPINMSQYTLNQGSAELAAIMLASYVEEIQQLFKTFTEQLSKKQFKKADGTLNSLILHSKIIAAQPLEADLLTLQRTLQTKQKKYQQTLLTAIQQHLLRLINFTESL
jgi:hypothetical protein